MAVEKVAIPPRAPERIPAEELRVNHYALVDGDLVFDTQAPRRGGPPAVYTTTDTAGCSCEQIVAALGLGRAHLRFGCTNSVMQQWVSLVGP